MKGIFKYPGDAWAQIKKKRWVLTLIAAVSAVGGIATWYEHLELFFHARVFFAKAWNLLPSGTVPVVLVLSAILFLFWVERRRTDRQIAEMRASFETAIQESQPGIAEGREARKVLLNRQRLELLDSFYAKRDWNSVIPPPRTVGSEGRVEMPPPELRWLYADFETRFVAALKREGVMIEDQTPEGLYKKKKIARICLKEWYEAARNQIGNLTRFRDDD